MIWRLHGVLLAGVVVLALAIALAAMGHVVAGFVMLGVMVVGVSLVIDDPTQSDGPLALSRANVTARVCLTTERDHANVSETADEVTPNQHRSPDRTPGWGSLT